MILASLLDLGYSTAQLEKDIKSFLGDLPFTLEITTQERHQLFGKKLSVNTPVHNHKHRTFKSIAQKLENSRLPEQVWKNSLQTFERVARAEARIHGTTIDKVSFHEVGALDSIVDIVGVMLLVDMINPDHISCSPLPLGRGFTRCQHGNIPLPAPATLEILKGVPIKGENVDEEMTTPTGAAILRTLSKSFGPIPAMQIDTIGYGIGSSNFKCRPNILRSLKGQKIPKTDPPSPGDEVLFQLESNIDDCTPEIIGQVVEQIFHTGALDAWTENIVMKKGRPAVKLCALAREDKLAPITEVVFKHSSSLGLRYHRVLRNALDRKEILITTLWGKKVKVRVKVGILANQVVNIKPEYEDCLQIAKKMDKPLKEIILAVKAEVIPRISASNLTKK